MSKKTSKKRKVIEIEDDDENEFEKPQKKRKLNELPVDLTKVTLREMSEKDIAKVIELDRENAKVNFWIHTKEDLSEKIKNQDFHCCCAMLNAKELVGYYIIGEVDDAFHMEIYSISVMKKYKKKGIGKKMFVKIEEKVKERIENKLMVAYTGIKNEEAQFFLEKIGFSKVKRIQKYYEEKEESEYQNETQKAAFQYKKLAE